VSSDVETQPQLSPADFSCGGGRAATALGGTSLVTAEWGRRGPGASGGAVGTVFLLPGHYWARPDSMHMYSRWGLHLDPPAQAT
jgi:hypothetical protein